MQPNKIPLVGIAGGIASGKSYITELLAEKGAAVINADQAAHHVLKLEEVKQLARERWGEAVFGPDGEVDRPRLGKIVFAPPPDGPRELKYLEQLIHPRVGDVIGRQVAELAEAASVPAIVLDVPLLFEAGWNKICDKVVFVDAPQSVRAARAAERGWSEEELARRQALQLSLDAKRQQSDVAIDNSGSRETARAQIDDFWQSLMQSSAAK
jgi:dephospho-CoA kinase